MPRRSASRTVSVAPMERTAAPRWLRPLLLSLAAILLLSLFTGEIRDTDIWLHLKTGQHSLETRALTVPDPFSYTSGMGAAKYPGEEVTRYFNLTHEWLAQVIMYVIYAAAGFPGLVLSRAALLMVFCGLAGWMAFRRTNDFYSSLAAALVCAGMAFHFQQSRPFLVTFVCLAVTMAILESRRWMWALPGVFLIWSNCHAGFFIGWLVMAAYCGEAVIERLRKRPVPNERRLWLVTLACFLVSGLNPNGFRVVQILFLYRSSGIQSENLEWQRPIFWEPGIYSLVLFGPLLALILARRRARPADWLLYFGFALISLVALRNTIFMGLVGAILMAVYLPRWRALQVIAPLLAAAALLFYDVAPAIARGNVFALRAAGWQLPSGAADYIQARGIITRMFNNYETGGCLVWRLWPMQRDFIDPRGLSEEVFADYKYILTHAASSGGESTEKLLQIRDSNGGCHSRQAPGSRRTGRRPGRRDVRSRSSSEPRRGRRRRRAAAPSWPWSTTRRHSCSCRWRPARTTHRACSGSGDPSRYPWRRCPRPWPPCGGSRCWRRPMTPRGRTSSAASG